MVNRDWINDLDTPGFRDHLNFLTYLPSKIDRIAEFGCNSTEPFALLWMLNASEIMVIEKKYRTH